MSTDERDLMAGGLVAKDVLWHDPEIELPLDAEVQIRYRHHPAPARITPLDPHSVAVIFHSSQRAVTPGQAAVFFSGSRLLGGGWIDRPLPP